MGVKSPYKAAPKHHFSAAISRRFIFNIHICHFRKRGIPQVEKWLEANLVVFGVGKWLRIQYIVILTTI